MDEAIINKIKSKHGRNRRNDLGTRNDVLKTVQEVDENAVEEVNNNISNTEDEDEEKILITI